MYLHSDPKVAEWDRRILSEMGAHYAFDDMFSWSNLPRVVDVGAHIGGFTWWVAQQNPGVEVIAVEADETNYDLAVRNLKPIPGATVVYGAVHYGHEPVALGLFREPDNAGSHTLRAMQDGDRAYMGPLLDLSSLLVLRGWTGADSLKLDCEGSEYGILAHADLNVLRGFKVIVGEYHDGPDRFRAECILRLAPWFDVVHLNTTAPLGEFCLMRKDFKPCG